MCTFATAQAYHRSSSKFKPPQVRAGAGGDEAALFAAELLDMYQQYAASRGWRFEVCHPVTQLPGWNWACNVKAVQWSIGSAADRRRGRQSL